MYSNTGFCSLILLLNFPSGAFRALLFLCLLGRKEAGSHASIQVGMSKSQMQGMCTSDLVPKSHWWGCAQGAGGSWKASPGHGSCWQHQPHHCPSPAFAATVTENQVKGSGLPPLGNIKNRGRCWVLKHCPGSGVFLRGSDKVGEPLVLGADCWGS